MENFVIGLSTEFWYAVVILIAHFGASLFVAFTKTKDSVWYKTIEKIALVTGKAKDTAKKTVKAGRKKK